MTIAMSARNAVEDLQVIGVFSDKQAPSLNRRFRNYAYAVLLAIQLLGGKRRHDTQLEAFFSEQAARDGAVVDL